jgi:sec-independent protein translocase protein TatB
MNVLGIGTGELLLILLIILLVVGPERLPQLVRQWAKIVKTLSQFTRTWQQFNAELNRQLTLEEMAGQQPRPVPKPAPTPAQPAPEPDEHTIAPPELTQQDSAGQPEPAEPPAVDALAASQAQPEAPASEVEEAQHER